MGRAIFIHPIAKEDRGNLGRPRGVQIGTQFASWTTIRRKAAERLPMLKSGHAYVVDPTAGLETFSALLAVAMTKDTALIWAEPADVPHCIKPVFPGLSLCPDQMVPSTG